MVHVGIQNSSVRLGTCFVVPCIGELRYSGSIGDGVPMIKYLVDMHILGRGDVLAIVEAQTITVAHTRVHEIADANDAKVIITEIIPWTDFVMQDMGFDLIPRR